MTIGQLVTYLTSRGDPRAAFVSIIHSATVLGIHVHLLPGDDDYAKGPVAFYDYINQDTTGTVANAWH